MLQKIDSFFARIDSDKTPLAYWLASLLAIILIRNLMEGVLDQSHAVAQPAVFFINHPLAYMFLFLGLAIILRTATKVRTAGIVKVLTVLFALILLVPVIDFVQSSGQWGGISYLFGDANYLANNFVTSYGDSAVTTGQKLEGAIFGSLLLIYALIRTKSYLKTIAVAVSSYCLLFFIASLPSFVYMFSAALFGNPLHQQMLLPGGEFNKELFSEYVSPDIGALMLSLIVALEAVVLFAVSDRRSFGFIMRALRPIRMFHYWFLGIFGMFLGFSLANTGLSPRDFIFALSFLLSAAFLYSSASLMNDLFDNDLHKRLRLAKSEVKPSLIKYSCICALVLSLLIAQGICAELAVIMACIASLAFLYSAPPFRLKRYPLIASLTLASCALMAVLAGFSVFAREATVGLFPPNVALAVMVAYTLGTNYKDLKDIKTDKMDRTYTIPVLLGEKRGKIAVGAMLAISFLSVPAILGIQTLFLPALLASLLSAIIIWRGMSEVYLRTMHLGYILLVIYLASLQAW